MTSPASEQPGDSFTIGSVIGGSYRILAFIGQGGMGYVYKVEHVVLTKILALKVLRQGQVSSEVWQRFRNEGLAIARLDHINIVKIYDMSQTAGGLPYYTMDFLEGESLADLLAQKGKLSMAEALPIFEQVCAGLGYAHDRGIIHRDIKPANIMILHGTSIIPQVKIVDFGIAKLLSYDRNVEQALTKPGEVFGSPIYMSPEQAIGKKVDYHTDMYSVGVTMFQILTGEPPLLGRNALETIALHQSVIPPSMSESDGECNFPPQLEEIVAQLMHKDPAQRYSSLYEVADELKEIEVGKTGMKIRRRASTQIEQSLVTTGKQAGPVMPVIITVLALSILAGAAYGAYSLYFPKETKQDASKAKSQFDVSYDLPIANAADRRLSDFAQDKSENRAKKDSDLAEQFLATNEKMYLLKVADAKYMEFNFPSNFSLGQLTCHNDRLARETTCSAQGVVRFPTGSRMKLELSAVARVHPQLLKFFRPDELYSIAVSHLAVKNQQLSVSLLRFTGLKHLDIHETVLDDSDLLWISKIQSLSSLNVCATKITAKALAASKILPHLSSLEVEYLVEMAPLLKALANNKKLHILSMACCNTSAQDYPLLAKLSTIRKLDLRNCKISDENMAQLQGLKDLEELSLDKCTGLTSKSMPVFKSFKRLEALILPLDLFPKEDLENLKKALPHTQIFS